jgi:GDPmannose 4,6-dehydratase
MPKALITGVCGQDGSYLAELLLDKGYTVFGLDRPGGDTHIRHRNITHLRSHPQFMIIHGDILDNSTLWQIAHGDFDEIYHLAAQSHVGQSFDSPTTTLETNTMATLRLLDMLRQHNPATKLYFAASSEMFGSMQYGTSANEHQQLSACSPYAASKIASYQLCKVYRQAHDLYIVNGISFNHESYRRGDDFVTKKIAKGIRKYVQTGEKLILGNVSAYRDWHHAKDTVKGMYLSMQTPRPADYVFASGEAHTVEAWLNAVCDLYKVNPRDATITHHTTQVRPWDVDYLCGNPQKAEQILGWRREYDFPTLVEDVCFGKEES